MIVTGSRFIMFVKIIFLISMYLKHFMSFNEIKSSLTSFASMKPSSTRLPGTLQSTVCHYEMCFDIFINIIIPRVGHIKVLSRGTQDIYYFNSTCSSLSLMIELDPKLKRENFN